MSLSEDLQAARDCLMYEGADEHAEAITTVLIELESLHRSLATKTQQAAEYKAMVEVVKKELQDDKHNYFILKEDIRNGWKAIN